MLNTPIGGITQNMYRCVLLHIFGEMHRIEDLKLVLYRISIENKEVYLYFRTIRKCSIFSFLIVSPRDGHGHEGTYRPYHMCHLIGYLGFKY